MKRAEARRKRKAAKSIDPDGTDSNRSLPVVVDDSATH